jgi:hypothetical protein
MIPEPAGIPAGVPSGAGNLAVAVGRQWAPRGMRAPHLAGIADIAERIEFAHPGYHVWVSDAGWWYATRTKTWARGQAATVHGPGPGELDGALAEEEAATMGRAMTGAW